MTARLTVRSTAIACVSALAVGLAGCAFIAPASLTTGGVGGDDTSGPVSVSGDGRYVAFLSAATNLVAGDTNGVPDIFVHDYLTGTTARVSVASDGSQANGPSDHPDISDDGSLVTFGSIATNLVAGDTNGVMDVFIRNTTTNTTTRVTNGATQLNGDSMEPSMTGEGSFVAFTTLATNAGVTDTNGVSDVVSYQTSNGALRYISVRFGTGTPSNGASSQPSVVGAGTPIVSFTSAATNLWPFDTSSTPDIFLGGGVATGVIAPVSNGGGGTNSAVAAHNLPTTEVEVVYRNFSGRIVRGVNMNTTTTTLTVLDSTANGASAFPSISSDGNIVAFESFATNIVGGDTNGTSDIFVRNVATGVTVLASRSVLLVSGDGPSGNAALSTDGRYVAFASDATNLATNGDTNGVRDVFLAYWNPPTVSSIAAPSIARGTSSSFTITGSQFENGATVSIGSGGVAASNVVFNNSTSLTVTLTAAAGATVGPRDVFVINPGGGPGTTASGVGRCAGCLTVTS